MNKKKVENHNYSFHFSRQKYIVEFRDVLIEDGEVEEGEFGPKINQTNLPKKGHVYWGKMVKIFTI